LRGGTAVILGFLAMCGLAGCAPAPDRAAQLREERLEPPFESIKRRAKPLGPPAPGDWLLSHHERGQSVAEFVAANPARPRPPKDVVEIVPIGAFDPAERRVLEATADHLGRFYGLRVRLLPDLSSASIAPTAFRDRADLGWRQLGTRPLLAALPALRSADAFAIIGLCADDLYPDSSWNFVFGQASPAERCGVWSMFRFGDPAASEEAGRLCRTRTFKTASHELGHMLGLAHCIAYRCLMNGSNHLGELDRNPLDLCPSCLAKTAWSTGVDPVAREGRLREFFATTNAR
jgi:archaemetzincin